MVKVCTVNVVASVNFGQKLDLKFLGTVLKSASKTKKFHGLIVRWKIPKCTFILFENGSVLVTGTKDTSIANECIQKLAFKIFNRYWAPPLKIGNLVGKSSLDEEDKHIFITATKDSRVFQNLTTNNRVVYEPERFAGLCFYTGHCLVVAFQTGKCIITGCKTETGQAEAMKHFIGW